MKLKKEKPVYSKITKNMLKNFFVKELVLIIVLLIFNLLNQNIDYYKRTSIYGIYLFILILIYLLITIIIWRKTRIHSDLEVLLNDYGKKSFLEDTIVENNPIYTSGFINKNNNHENFKLNYKKSYKIYPSLIKLIIRRYNGANDFGYVKEFNGFIKKYSTKILIDYRNTKFYCYECFKLKISIAIDTDNDFDVDLYIKKNHWIERLKSECEKVEISESGKICITGKEIRIEKPDCEKYLRSTIWNEYTLMRKYIDKLLSDDAL